MGIRLLVPSLLFKDPFRALNPTQFLLESAIVNSTCKFLLLFLLLLLLPLLLLLLLLLLFLLLLFFSISFH